MTTGSNAATDFLFCLALLFHGFGWPAKWTIRVSLLQSFFDMKW
jgi:hypothetical protein